MNIFKIYSQKTMITPKIREKLKEHLKDNYTEDVLKILKDNKITNRNGGEYSSSMIKNVLNGQENIEIEKAITIVYHQRKKAFLKHQKQLKKVLI